jgi:hypothetical protein
MGRHIPTIAKKRAVLFFLNYSTGPPLLQFIVNMLWKTQYSIFFNRDFLRFLLENITAVVFTLPYIINRAANDKWLNDFKLRDKVCKRSTKMCTLHYIFERSWLSGRDSYIFLNVVYTVMSTPWQRMSRPSCGCALVFLCCVFTTPWRAIPKLKSIIKRCSKGRLHTASL